MRRVLLIVLLMLAGAGLAGDIYKWSDDSGQTVFGDRPPAGQTPQSVVLPPAPPKPVLDAAQEALARDRAARTRLDVWGTFVVRVASVGDAAMARPPFAIHLLFQNKPGAPLEPVAIRDLRDRWETQDTPNEHVALSEQNFHLLLLPGEYRIPNLEIDAADLSSEPLRLLIGLKFSVPSGQCVYLGRITVRLLRLPPEAMDDTKARFSNVADLEPPLLLLIPSPRGTMILVGISLDQPGADEPRWSLSGAGWAFDHALSHGCLIATPTVDNPIP